MGEKSWNMISNANWRLFDEQGKRTIYICENLWILFITTRDFVVNTYALGVMWNLLICSKRLLFTKEINPIKTGNFIFISKKNFSFSLRATFLLDHVIIRVIIIYRNTIIHTIFVLNVPLILFIAWIKEKLKKKKKGKYRIIEKNELCWIFSSISTLLVAEIEKGVLCTPPRSPTRQYMSHYILLTGVSGTSGFIHMYVM